MAVFSLKDPRLNSSHCLAKKVMTEIQLKRVRWDHNTLTTSFKRKKKHTTKKPPKTSQIQHKAYVTIASPPVVLHETLRRNSVESIASTCSTDSGKSSTENASLQFEASSHNINNGKHDLPPPSPEAIKRLKSLNGDGDRKKICCLEREPTLLENYLMRIHELVRIAVDETYVENQCKKLLSAMVKTVSFEPKEVFSERRL